MAASIDAARIKEVLQSSDVAEIRETAHRLQELTQPNSPQEARLLQLQIMLWNRIARLDEAIHELECFQTVGALWTRMGEIDKAMGQLTKALALDSENALTHSLIGEAMFHASNYAPSIEAHEKSIELYQQQGGAKMNSNLAEAYSKLGTVLESKGDFKEAIETIYSGKTLIELEEATDDNLLVKAELLAKVGGIHDRLGEYQLAVTELEEATSILKKIKGDDDPQVQEIAFILEMARTNAADE
jgi:tetratricopeptide (TPR) repeat protein